MFNPLPAIALLPLALIWFGLGYGSIVFVIVHSVLWAVALNTHSGFLSVSTTLRMVGRNYGLSGPPLCRRHPDSGGISQHSHRTQDRLGVRVAHADRRRARLRRLLGSGGLGWFIYENKNQLEIPSVFAGLFTVILIGLARRERHLPDGRSPHGPALGDAELTSHDRHRSVAGPCAAARFPAPARIRRWRPQRPRALVYADAHGLASHGVSRVPQYSTHLRNGRADGDAQPQIVNAKGGTVLVDAYAASPFPPARWPSDAAIRRAREFGIAFSGVTNSHHFGAGRLSSGSGRGRGNGRPRDGQLAGRDGSSRRAAAAARHQPDRRSVSARTTAAPLLIDLSLSEVARGKLMVAARRARSIPLGLGARRRREPDDRSAGGTRGLDAARWAGPRARCWRSSSNCSCPRSPGRRWASKQARSSSTRATGRGSARHSSSSIPDALPAATSIARASRL